MKLQMALNRIPLGTQQLERLGALPIQLGNNGILARAVFSPSQLLQVHLVRPIRNPQRPDHRPQIRQRRILTHTSRAVRLHGTVDDRQRSLRHKNLGLGDLLERGLGVALVDFDRGVEDDQTRGVDLDA